MGKPACRQDYIFQVFLVVSVLLIITVIGFFFARNSIKTSQLREDFELSSYYLITPESLDLNSMSVTTTINGREVVLGADLDLLLELIENQRSYYVTPEVPTVWDYSLAGLKIKTAHVLYPDDSIRLFMFGFIYFIFVWAAYLIIFKHDYYLEQKRLKKESKDESH